MKSVHSFFGKIKQSEAVRKLRSIKNVELIIAAVLALIAFIVFFSLSVQKKTAVQSTVSVEAKMTEEEKRLASILSKIDGVGEANVYISYGEKKEVTGVVVVAKNMTCAEKKIPVIRCVEIATGVPVDQIQIFQMENGG